MRGDGIGMVETVPFHGGAGRVASAARARTPAPTFSRCRLHCLPLLAQRAREKWGTPFRGGVGKRPVPPARFLKWHGYKSLGGIETDD